MMACLNICHVLVLCQKTRDRIKGSLEMDNPKGHTQPRMQSDSKFAQFCMVLPSIAKFCWVLLVFAIDNNVVALVNCTNLY